MEDFDILQGKIADLTKTADKPGGISLFRDKEKTEYKSTYEVLKDISEIYHDLTDKNQAALLEALAGKRGGQVLAGILDDFSEVERAMGEIEDSAGSANDEMKIVSESITFKLNALKQTWVDFLTDVLNRETTGQFIDNLTKISEKLIALLEEHPGVALMEVATAFKIIGSVLKGNLISKSVTSLTQLINTLTGIKTGGVLGAFAAKTGVFGATIAPIKEAADKYREVADAAKQAGQATQTAGQMASYSTVNGFRVAITGMTQMAAAEQGAAAGGAALTGSMSALLPVLATVAGVIAAVAIGAYAWDRVTTTVKEAEEELNSVSGKIETITSQIKELEDLDYRTAAQEKKLQFLRDELELEEKIYAVKQRQVIQEQFGNKFSDYTDKDNYRAKFRQENRGEEGTASYLLTINKTQQEDIKDYYSEIAFYNKQIEGLQNQINAGTLAEGTGAAQIEAINKKILETKDKIAEKELEQNSTQADITAKAIEYTEAIEDMESKLEMMKSNRDLYTVEDIASVKEVIKLYKDQLDTLRQAQGIYAAETGAEYASAIESAFEHVEFEGVKDKLVQMGKDGSLSVEYLANNFEELLSVMGLTTDQADILYAYLMRLADPLRSERNNFASQWQPTSTGAVGEYQQQQYEQVMKYINSLSDEEFQILLDAGVDWSTFDYKAFREKAEELLNQDGPVSIDIEPSTIADSVTGINERLKSQFDELGEAYKAIYFGDNGFSLKDVDNAMLKGIVDNFITSAVELGIAQEDAEKSANKFMDTLTNQESTAEDVQQAFNDLATSYFYSAEGLKELNKDTADAIRQQLKQLGIVNADEIVEFYLQPELERNFASRIKNEVGTEMSKLGEGGGVDLELRPKVDTSILNEVGWEAGEGVATVFSSTFSNEAGNIAINFTPIIADENGNMIDVLEPEALEEYAYGVIEGVHDDYLNLQIGAKFEGQDAIDQASQAAEKIHELQDVYYNYGEILRGVNDETANEVEAQLEAAGVTDAHAIVVQSLNANLEAQALESDAVEAATSDMAGETENASAQFVQEANMSNLAKVYLVDLVATQTVFNQQGLDVSQKIEALSALASAYLGAAAQASFLNKVQNTAAGGHGTISPELAWQQILDEFSMFEAPTVDFSQVNEQNTRNAGGAGKDAGKAYVDGFNEELSKLKESYERGEMSLSEYLNAYKALIEKYFSDTEKYAEERAKALHDYMQELKGYYDSAISGVTTLIDHRIKAVQKQKDAALKAIEDERKAAKAAYEERKKEIEAEIKAKQKEIKALEDAKKPLEDQIKAIRDANAERDRQNDLMEKQYNLQKMMNQRTRLIYKGNQLVYEQDTSNIRSAREELRDAEDETRIAAIQKQIDALDKAIELKQAEIDLLEEESAMIDEELAAIDEFYDKLVEETTAAFDAILEQLEQTKSKWEELAEIDKIASAWKDVGGVMEMLGYSVEDVLNDTPGAFEAFEQAYIATLSGLNNGNDQYLQGLSQVTGKTVEELKAMGIGVANISKDTQQPMADIADSVEKLGTNSSTASGHVSSLGSSVSTTTSNVNELNTSTKTANDNLNATNKISLDAVKQQVDNLKDSAEKLRQELDGTNSGGKTIKDLLEDINQVTFTGIIENLNGLSLEVEKIAKSITEGLAKALEADTTAQEAAQKLGVRIVGDEKGTGLGKGVEQGSPSESAKRVAQSIPKGITEILDHDTTAEDSAETLGKDIVKALGDSIETDLNAMQIDFSTIFGDTDFGLLAQQFNDLGLAIQTVADALGMGQDASVGGLFQAISDLNSIDLGVESGAGVIGQFNALKGAIDSVSSAIGSAGGGEGASGGFVGNTNAQVSAMQGAGGGSGSSLSSSIEGLKSTAEAAIGTVVAEEGAEGDGTVIGDFGALTTSVSNATAAIGTTESEADAGDLIGSIASLNEKSQEYMVADSDAAGDDGIVPRFNKLNEVIAEAEDHISGIEAGLKAIDELEEVECTIKINIETSGDMPTFSFRMTGSAMPWEGMNLESGEYIAKYATGTAYPHQYGTANVKGNWGVQQPGKSLVGELGQEVIIRDGRFWTVGDNGPEFVNLQKDDIVLNHLQTREILSKKNLIKPKGASGRAYANGTLPNGLTPLSLADPEQFAQFMQLADALKTNTEDMRVDLSDLSTMARDIERSITNTTYNNSNRNANITFGDLNFTCTGITSADVLSEVSNALQQEFNGIALNAYQRAMAH